MSNLRFALCAAAIFGLAFAGVTFGMPWTPKKPPAMHGPPPTDPAPPAPPAPPQAPVPEVAETLDEAIRGSIRPNEDAGRHQLARTAILAANAYARAPCDMAAKAAFIVSASTYIRAEDGTTPFDAKAREAIEAALRAGGISGDEFPAGTRVTAIARPSRASPCGSAAALRR